MSVIQYSIAQAGDGGVLTAALRQEISRLVSEFLQQRSGGKSSSLSFGLQFGCMCSVCIRVLEKLTARDIRDEINRSVYTI